jgi:LacI family transcriptional regulator
MTARERFEGAKRVLQQKGLFNEELVRSGPYTFESGFENMLQLLNRNEQVDAIFCTNDMIAIGAIKAIESRGYRVPEDIAVIGFDDIKMASLLKPTLTTIRQPTYDMGKISVRMVVERIEGVAAEIRKKIVLPGELMIRASTTKGFSEGNSSK